MNKQERKRNIKILLYSGWNFDGDIFTHRTLSPEGCTLDLAVRLNQDKKIDPSKLIKQIMRKGR